MKNKKSNYSENTTFDEEQRTSTIKLIGLFIIVYCIVSVTNGLGSYLRVPFTYLFGSLGIIILIPFILLIGFYLFIAKKPFSMFSNIQYVLIGLILFLLTLLSTILTFISHDQVMKFADAFSMYGATFKDYFSNGGSIGGIGTLGGGLFGYIFTGLFNTLTGSNMVTLVITIILLVGSFIIVCLPYLKRFISWNKIHTKKMKEKKMIRNQRQKEKENLRVLKQKNNTQEKVIQSSFSTPTASILKSNDVCVENKEVTIIGDNYEYRHPIINENKKNLKSMLNVFDDEIYGTTSTKTSEESPLQTVSHVHVSNAFDEDVFQNEVEKQEIEEITPVVENRISDPLISKEVQLQDTTIEEKPVNEVSKPTINVFSYVDPYKKDEVVEEKQTEEVNVKKPQLNLASAPYELPPLYLLKDASDNGATARNEEVAKEKADVLMNKIHELNVDATINNFVVGPSVTRFEITLAAGVRVNTFVNLQEDFKLALGVNSIRIEAPIPGKSAIGIEVPNKFRANVSLKEIITSLPDKKSKLFVPVGKDIGGVPISVGICNMPHCLISGATNSGKSVCANAIIVSLLMNYKPSEVRMIMVDPKRVEMLFYVDIPHLLCPIITEANKAMVALDKLCKRMMERFDVFAMEGVKNIGNYNDKMVSEGRDKMPFIILVVDELAELMLSKKSQIVEEKIQKLVQLGRAAGIHLILSTQRPDVNVITGTIKSNIPCRMTFRLSSLVDSRTVIDVGGAEKLLNNGDMLLLTPDYTGLRRVQGVYVSDNEITDVVNHCKKQLGAQYDEDFLDLRTDEEKQEDLNMKNAMLGNTTSSDAKGNDDELYEDIKRCVLNENKASTSFLQRKFSIGYGKAARMIDRLEDDGIIGPENGSRGREVYGVASEEEILDNEEPR